MRAIPEDIRDAAHDCWGTICGRGHEISVDGIARAILAERERCAGIAEDHASTHDSRVADWIASAIRGPKT